MNETMNEEKTPAICETAATTAGETTPKHTKLTGIYIFLSVLLAAVLACIALCFVTLRSNKDLNNSVKSLAAAQGEEETETAEGTTQENDVVIADEYTIRSTQQISDAYKSGDTSQLSAKDKETLDMASKILDGIITDGMTDFEKEKAVYDWMTKNLQTDEGLTSVIPTTQADCDNPYGVLKYHNAVCVGYATTFRLFMQMMNITCMVVHNTEAYHSWDLVQLDGNWYHTDIYMDVGNGNYADFNMTDTMCMNSHDWDTSFFPAANSLEYNMAYQTAQDATDVYQIPTLLRASLDKGDSILGLKFGSDLSQEDGTAALSMVSRISELLMNAQQYQSLSLSYSWDQTDNGYLLSVYITRSNESSETGGEITDETQQKMDTAISSAFGDIDTGDDTAYGTDYGY
jgi:hypothetical protein